MLGWRGCWVFFFSLLLRDTDVTVRHLSPAQAIARCNTWSCWGHPASGLERKALWNRAEQENCERAAGFFTSGLLLMPNKRPDSPVSLDQGFLWIAGESILINTKKGSMNMQKRETGDTEITNIACFKEATFHIELNILFTVHGIWTGIWG